ncbi:MAG TPA: hypothetical protein VLI54_06835 [Bacillota bacterium]|nr:hypothetical protein [Bacillota bacterium]
MSTPEEPFSFLAAGMDPACYFGCPSTDFRSIEQGVQTREHDVLLAQQAGVSEAGVVHLAERVADARHEANQTLARVPTESCGPWRVPEEHAKNVGGQVIRCCRYSGVTVVGAKGGTITFDRIPAATEQ